MPILRQRRIYIAGPMRGHFQFNFDAFDSARDHLKEHGWNVVSPADLDRENGFDPSRLPDNFDWMTVPDDFNLEDAIRRDVEAILQCDAIYMLKGWEDSKGATAEKSLAEWRRIEVMYEDEPSPVEGETVTNASGGKQSHIKANFDCIPPECLRLLAQCLGFGANKYGKDNWKQIEFSDNLNHAMNHINEWRRGDRVEPHLVNAMARLTFALWQAVDDGSQDAEYIHPEMTA